MTRPVDSDAALGTEDSARPRSRREARKEWLAQQSADGNAAPKSIFDLPYVPRKRFLPPPEPVAELKVDADTAQGREPLVDVLPPLDSEVDAQLPELTELAEPTELPAPVSAKKLRPKNPAQKTLPAKKLPVKKMPLPPKREEPAADRILPIHPKPAPTVEGTLLFDRIPEPDPVLVRVQPAEPATDVEAQRQPRSPRRMLAAVFASVAAFGLMLTLALPALAPATEDVATADDGQVLASGGSSEALIDFEAFESLDELEAAAEAATLEAGSFANEANSDVQYPFSKGVPLTDGFGPRAFPVSGFHDAQDFAAGYGAAVRSIAAGTVIESGPTSDGCGFGLKIEHQIDGQTVRSRYCHLAINPIVAIGEQVRVGQFVGLVGNSGLSFGPHLHLVIEVNGEAVDPMSFIAKYNKPRPSNANIASS